MGTIKISWVNNDSNYKNLDNCSSVRSYLWVLWIMGVREEKKILKKKKSPNPRGRTSLCLDFQRESLPTISLSFLWDNTLKTLFFCVAKCHVKQRLKIPFLNQSIPGEAKPEVSLSCSQDSSSSSCCTHSAPGVPLSLPWFSLLLSPHLPCQSPQRRSILNDFWKPIINNSLYIWIILHLEY